MITFKQYLLEARKNPEQNIIKPVLDQVKDIAIDHPNAFITFTRIPKFGANPSSKFNTPLGVCSYPISYVIEEYMQVPYAASSRYIFIFEPKSSGKYWNFSTTDANTAFRSIRLATNRVLQDQQLSTTSESSNKEIYQDMYNAIHRHISGTDNPYRIGQKFTGPYSTLARKIIMTAGYDGIIDPGAGVIHINEPTQAIFFRLDQVSVLTMIRNKLVRYIDSRHHTPITSGDQWKARLNYAIAVNNRDRDVEKGGAINFVKDLAGGISASCDLMIDYSILFDVRIPTFEKFLLQSNAAGKILEYTTKARKCRWPEAESILRTSNNPNIWPIYVRYMEKLGVII
jgi:hypothetical protein